MKWYRSKLPRIKIAQLLSDLLYFNSGIWILSIPLFCTSYFQEHSYLVFWGLISLFTTFPHTIAPFLLFFDPAYSAQLNSDVKKNSIRFLYLWLFLGISFSSLAVFYYKLNLRAYFNFLILLVALHFFWNFFHFGMQHFGVLSIFAKRSQKVISPKTLKIEKFFCLQSVTISMILNLLFMIKYNSGLQLVLTQRMIGFENINQIKLLIQILIWGGFGLGCVLIYLSRWSPSRCAYLATIAIQPAVAFYLFKSYFFFSFTITHCITELFLISKIRSSLTESNPSWYFGSFFRTLTSIVVVGYIITFLTAFLIEEMNLDSIYATLVFLPGKLNSETHGLYIISFLSIYWWIASGHFYLDKIIYSSKSYRDSNFLKKTLLDS